MTLHCELIGGPGKVVEIDEALFGKRTYNRGRRRDQRWVLGGIERGTYNMFMAIVPNRCAATLLPIIQANVLYGPLATLGYTYMTQSTIPPISLIRYQVHILKALRVRGPMQNQS